MLSYLRSRGAALAAALAVVVVGGGLVWRWTRTDAASTPETAPSSTLPLPLIAGHAPVVSHPPQVYDYKPRGRSVAGIPLRPMDVAIFERLARADYHRQDMLDLFPDQPYHVKLVGSFTDHWIDIIMVDLDRDGHFDERWVLKPDEVRRTTIDVNAADLEGGTPFTLRPGRWLPY